MEQVRAFSSALIVLGPHGAGLTNILFCRRGAHVMEMGKVLFPCYVNLADRLGVHYHHLAWDGHSEKMYRPGLGERRVQRRPLHLQVMDALRFAAVMEQRRCPRISRGEDTVIREQHVPPRE